MNINNYAAQCGLLHAEVGNIKQWVWPGKDTQTFNIIVQDWVNHIRPFIVKHFKGDQAGSVIQAGGNCGVYPLLYTELFESVYTFEPDPLSFFCLVNNCQVPGITKFNAALSNVNHLVTVNELIPENRGMNKVEANSKTSTRTVPAVTIDSFNFQDVKLIQLDLEGYETNAIKGALNTIKKYNPVIILECGDLDNPGDLTHHKACCELMESINYVNHSQISRLDVVFLPKD